SRIRGTDRERRGPRRLDPAPRASGLSEQLPGFRVIEPGATLPGSRASLDRVDRGGSMTVDRATTPPTHRFRTSEILLDGLFTGAIGALAVALWFLILDFLA